MSRYTVSTRPRTPPANQPPPAIWRGIGCVLMVGVPASAWFLADLTVQWALENGWPLPYQLVGYPVLPKLLLSLRGLAPVLAAIQAQQNLYAVSILCIAYTILGGTLISLLYAIAYQLVGPPRYGPLDAPPAPLKARRYKR